MSDPHICDDKDLKELCPSLDLWLKPQAKLNITVALPRLKVLDNSGKTMTISTWEVMDKLKKKIKPLKFKTIKVSKSTIEFIRFEAECESLSNQSLIESRLNKMSLKLSGFIEQLTVKTARVKIGSTRHEWETYFRDNPLMNEMKPGLRPDTIHVQSLPVKWLGGERPKPNLLVKLFGTFGDIRRFHIPCLDTKEEEGFKRFTFNESLSFEAFIQYRDYIGFVKAMDALRGMKLVKKLSEIQNQKNNHLEYDIKVDFDKTRHLSDKAIKRRRIQRQFAFSSDPAVQALAFKSMMELKRLRAETKRQLKKLQEEADKQGEGLRNGDKTREKSPDNCKQTQTTQTEISPPRSPVSGVQSEEKHKKELESRKRAEQKVKDKLLLEEVKLREILVKKREEREVKLREILIEKRRERLRSEAKGKLKSVANVTNNCQNNNKNNTINNNIRDTNNGHHLHSNCNPSNILNERFNSNMHSYKSYSFHSYHRKHPNNHNNRNNNNYLNYRRSLFPHHHQKPHFHPPLHYYTTEEPILLTQHRQKKHRKGCKHYKNSKNTEPIGDNSDRSDN